jgi:hypothetical protein
VEYKASALSCCPFSTDYLRYQSCLEAVLKENTYLHELEKKEKEKEQLQEKLNNLLLRLKEKGIDLDEV